MSNFPDLSQVSIEEAPRLTELKSFGPILNATDTLGWLSAHEFVGWTYSINLKLWTWLHPKKLIVDRCDKIYNSRIRRASACHLKCYIGDISMLIGSFNLTAPTIEDLSVVISDKKQVEFMRKQFNQHWKALT